ncbi:hypothetical protein [Gorillibacterium massiliense]|uniref:hypothetical protein n=1 Tax=Gorillibacterium massiliense TaxID=1280390 RepID=UPI0004B56778|nr:hypothetical protein [Gorillibacterium massiliense]
MVLSPSPSAKAAPSVAKEVTATLPAFPVTLNGIAIDNAHRQYPLIVYKGITYFPMTYYDTRFLGLETTWTAKIGLGVSQTGISGAYRDGYTAKSNPKTFKASLREGVVKVNGFVVQADREDYPFLSYRGIAYFPLTWKWAKTEFGWSYHFDAKKGLAIDSANQQLIATSLPGYKGGEYTRSGAYHYYIDEKGGVYQLKVDGTGKPRKMYQLPIWDYGDGKTLVGAGLSSDDNDSALLTYHQGGATMGYDESLRLNANGTVESLSHTSSVGPPPPPPGNIGLEYTGGSYGITAVTNQYIYSAAYLPNVPNSNAIWRTDKTTLETERVSGLPADKVYSMEVWGDFLYWINDGKLYRVPLDAHLADGEAGRLLETHGAIDLQAPHLEWNGSFYFVTAGDGKLYRIPWESQDNDVIDAQLVPTRGKINRQIWSLQVFNDGLYYLNDAGDIYAVGSDQPFYDGSPVMSFQSYDDYLVCFFANVPSNPYRMTVQNLQGQIVFKTADIGSGASIQSGVLTYLLDGTAYRTVLQP